MTAETRALLADCAGSYILLMAFVALVLMSTALFMAWRGLMEARRATPGGMAVVRDLATQAGTSTRDTAAAVVAPQIRLSSAWAGLKAGARVLVRGAAPPVPAQAGAIEAARTGAVAPAPMGAVALVPEGGVEHARTSSVEPESDDFSSPPR